MTQVWLDVAAFQESLSAFKAHRHDQGDLCPDCLAKADDNGFLRGRVRTALRDRAAAAEAVASGHDATAGDWEDWYLRRGRYARGPIHDGPWTMELDEVTRWIDGLNLAGTLVELGAGMGWWTGLLAEKGELWVYDSDGASLDAARSRLMAHGLLAHLHERDPLARPDKEVDVVFAAYLLGSAGSPDEVDRRLQRVVSWLRPGGSGDGGPRRPARAAHQLGCRGARWPRRGPRLQAGRGRQDAAGLRLR